MGLGKVNKNKKIKQTDIIDTYGEEETPKGRQAKLITEDEVVLPELTKQNAQTNSAKSAEIKVKKKWGKVLAIGAVAFIGIVVTANTVLNKNSEVVVEEPNEVQVHEETNGGSTDVSGLITLEERNKDRKMLTHIDDYINLNLDYPNDYFIKEQSSEGLNIIRANIREGDTKYSLVHSKLQGVVPVIEMRNKRYTGYTIRMQIGHQNDYKLEDTEYLQALLDAKDNPKQRKKKKGEDKDAPFYRPYENEKVDYLNYCPLLITEYTVEDEKLEENTDKAENKKIPTTDGANKPTIQATKTEEKPEDKLKEKGEVKEGETPTEEEPSDYLLELEEQGITLEKKTVTIPCNSTEYLQSRTAVTLPMGYSVKQDNTLEGKQKQLAGVEEKPTEKPQYSIGVPGGTEPDGAEPAEETEEVPNGEEDTIEEQQEKPVEELPIVTDAEGNEIEKTETEVMQELFAEVHGGTGELGTLDTEYDYTTFKLREKEVNVNSLLLDYNGREVKYYEFKFTLGGNDAYLVVYGELDTNINYILEDIRQLIDSITYG